MAGTQYETKSYQPVDEADSVSCKPNFICPIYAAYLDEKHKDNVSELSSLIKITPKTPSTFLAVTSDDKMRGVVCGTVYQMEGENEVLAELQVYGKGGHGYGIRESANPVSSWHQCLAEWLKASDWLENKEGERGEIKSTGVLNQRKSSILKCQICDFKFGIRNRKLRIERCESKLIGQQVRLLVFGDDDQTTADLVNVETTSKIRMLPVQQPGLTASCFLQ